MGLNNEPQAKAANRLTIPMLLTVGLLGGNVAFAAMEIYFSFWSDTVTNDQWIAFLEIEEWALPLFGATAIAFVVWSFLAHSNLDAFGRVGQVHSHQATIWWWIVPIANLFMPYKVVFETSRGSTAVQGDDQWRSEPVRQSVFSWTGLFISGLVALAVAAETLEEAFSVSQIDLALQVNGVAYLVWGGAAVAAIVMILQITNAQKSLAWMWISTRDEAFGDRTARPDPRSRFLGESDEVMARSNILGEPAPGGSQQSIVQAQAAAEGTSAGALDDDAIAVERRLAMLDELRRRNVLSESEYQERRRQIIAEI